MINIGSKIKKLREANNLSQRDFAALINRNHSLISRADGKEMLLVQVFQY